MKMLCGGPGLCSECAADAYRARAALAQPSPAPELDDQAFDHNAERLTLQALGPGAGINPEATSIDDIFLDESPAPALPERGTQHRFSTTEQTCRHGFSGVWWNDNGVTKTGRECRHCGFFVADVSEAPELERPEVVAWRYGFSGGIVSDKACLDEWKSGGEYQSLMTVAQHERISAQLHDALDECDGDRWKLRSERDAANARLHEVATACATAEQERDVAQAEVERLTSDRDNCLKARRHYATQLGEALARVAELERGKVYVEARRCDECQHGGINDSATGVAACHECDWTGPEPEEDKCPGCQRENCMAAACPQCGARYVLVASEEIAAPVAQAQHLHDLDKQCRDDVARALGLRPSQERGFAWSYLLDSIKSCVKASEDAAQAQHSVPEEFSFEYRHPNGECHTVTVSREQVINEMPDFLFEALCSKFCNCEPVGETNVVECCCDEYAEEFKLIAAAPGKEVGHE
ncbi:hypothetical protein [Pseudomonas aeruginosa]|uniref:hypothetical protein n=1 Tax=Pseudomonas aeruginosa TaxID=287 RepID=UPI00287D9C1D|nr:hypothetical protein [Pseudomonas aeruginosa]MDS9748121.1 hypothetical protein [Pseudomonas aeruginosa]MDS9771942.1 hypothetical protein [Pseudomonas aeruginosa]MDS9798607.1 hypothetical protein [Pseudomonas aeruginosa]